MKLKLFIPVILLAIIQLVAFFYYSGFSFIPDIFSKYLVSSFYIFFIFSILFFCFFSKEKNKKNFLEKNQELKINRMDLLVLFFCILLIVKPTIIMLIMGNTLGFDYVRSNFFSSDIIRGKAFGNMTLAILVQNYFVPFLWFYTVMMINHENSKKREFIFYLFLFSLILFNLSYAGRFYIYFSIIALYIKSIIQQGSLFTFFRKYLAISSMLIFLSFFILELRKGEEQIAQDQPNTLLMLLEYHILQPFFFSQKVYNGEIYHDGYPFRTLIEGVFAPIFYFLGTDLKELQQGQYPIIFSNFTLYSNYSDSYYNAFATFFPYFYSDYGVLAPIFLFFIMIYILFSSNLISGRDIRIKFLGFIALMLYFSLFQSMILSYGCLIIIFLFPVVNYIWTKLILKKG